MAYATKAENAAYMQDWRARKRAESPLKVRTPMAESKAAYYEANKTAWTHWNWKRYGLSPEDWYSMSEAQEGRCAICGEMPIKRLVVDHNHDTDEVRALLCSSCNVRLGSIEDEDFLQAAQRYLSSY